MRSFATIDDYVRRYGDDEQDVSIVRAVLEDASRLIAAELERHGIDWQDPDPDYAERLSQVCRDMAHRSLSVRAVEFSENPIPYGATQHNLSANGFVEYVGFQNSSSSGFGEVYMTKAEKKLLGIPRQRIRSLAPYPLGKRGCDVCEGRR